MAKEKSTVQDNSLDIKSLGSYTIDSRLGQGGMGIVYLATDKDLGRHVAIKVLHPHLLKHDNLKQRFRREARMHAKLMHPNIVTLLSLYEDDEHMALVMEVVKGHDLKTFLRQKNSLSLKSKLDIAIKILKGLEAAHEFGMVHRDLKPANVLVSKKGDVKLLDFGLAKPEAGSDDLTQSGATVGSFRYMAPEQILNSPIDARTDLYAFGILLFYMVVGKLPFDASSNGGEFEIMEKQVRDPAPSPHEIDSSIPLPLSNLILKLLEKNKQHRPKDAATVRAELKIIQEQLHFLTEKPQPQKINQEPQTPHLSNSHANLTGGAIAKQWVKFGHRQAQDILTKINPSLKKPHADLAIIAFVFIILGGLSINILSMAEDTAIQTNIAQQAITKKPVAEAETTAATKPKPTPPKETPAVAIKEEVKSTPVLPEPKKVSAAPAKAKPVKLSRTKKTKPKPKKVASRPVTYQKKHSVLRSDKSTANSNESHEFRGGNHLFFPELSKKSWIKAFKRGESEVVFEKPVSLSQIIIHKASIGKLDFKRGVIQLEVQPADSSGWKRLFERKNKAIDDKVSIKGFKKKFPLINAVRIKFKTAEPITIGPIDLIQ